MLRDSILRLHIVGYSPKYIVKFENFYLKSTEFAVQICVPNYNEIQQKKSYGKSHQIVHNIGISNIWEHISLL